MYVENLKMKPDITVDEIGILMDDETDVKILKKLFYFRLRAFGFPVKEAHLYANVKLSTAYNLEDLWNEGGYNSLLRKPGGGRETKLNKEQLKELENILNSLDTILVNDILKLIKNKWGIEYSYVGLKNLLITQFDVKIDNYYENQDNNKIEKIVENFEDDFNDNINNIIDLMDCEKDLYVYKKLTYLLFKEIGFSTKITSKLFKMTSATGNNWSNQWKNKGHEGLSRKPGQGRKSKLTPEKFKKAKKN